MSYILETLDIPFAGKVVFYFVEKVTSVPYPPRSYVQGRIFLPESDDLHYMSLPSLGKAREYLDQLMKKEVKCTLSHVDYQTGIIVGLRLIATDQF